MNSYRKIQIRGPNKCPAYKIAARARKPPSGRVRQPSPTMATPEARARAARCRRHPLLGRPPIATTPRHTGPTRPSHAARQLDIRARGRGVAPKFDRDSMGAVEGPMARRRRARAATCAAPRPSRQARTATRDLFGEVKHPRRRSTSVAWDQHRVANPRTTHNSTM